MARYQTKITYDGSHFQGFQKQAEARTVQGSVETALREIGWKESSILAAGRTDTGVHASGQVVSFDMDWSHSETDLRSALNANLPADIAARSVEETHPTFHPRFDALRRCYRYHIYCNRIRDPLRDRYSWRVWPAIDIERMQQAAELLEGEHDFSAFGSPMRPGGRTIRYVFEAEWCFDDGFIFQITANAFLYHMVRRLVYYQTVIGQGRIEPEAILSELESNSPEMVQGLAPPNGLFLSDVLYADEPGNEK